MGKKQRALVWLRRDLRLKDHTALAYASSRAEELVFAFVFDTTILSKLADRNDRRVNFFHQSLRELDQELRERGSQLVVRHGDPRKEIPQLTQALNVQEVHVNEDYEPAAKERDRAVADTLQRHEVGFFSHKDHVIFSGLEICSQSGTAFKVFTPYKNTWLKTLKPEHYAERKPVKFQLAPQKEISRHSRPWELADIGFRQQELWLEPGFHAAVKRLKRFHAKLSVYQKTRDFPAQAGTSGLSAHLRFGTLSIRACVRAALSEKNVGAQTWLSELIWRDFYQMVLDQNPHLAAGRCFKPECDRIRWPGPEAHFRAWCEGRTGYPLVDAAMREFNATGWMHNRLRMVVASFLTKDLLVDWRKGEEYFARYLLDFDLAANNGGWQWSASTGCDAQPYFRIFNPYSQAERFDPKGDYVRKYVPELAQAKGKTIFHPETEELFSRYPAPIVDHKIQRTKALQLFQGLK